MVLPGRKAERSNESGRARESLRKRSAEREKRLSTMAPGEKEEKTAFLLKVNRITEKKTPAGKEGGVGGLFDRRNGA